MNTMERHAARKSFSALAWLSMDLLPHGLPLFAALACLAFTVYAATSRSAA